VTEGARSITGRGQGAHQPLGPAGVGGIERCQPAPPEYGACLVSPRGGRYRRRLEQPPVVGGEPVPLLVGPAGEGGSARQVEVAQEGTGVQPSRLLQCPRCSRGLERRDVHLDQLRVEPQLAGAEDRFLRTELLAQGVQRLVQVPPGALLLDVAPQEARQPVAAHPAVSRPREDREQREPPRLLGIAAQRPAAVEHGKAAERLDALHG